MKRLIVKANKGRVAFTSYGNGERITENTEVEVYLSNWIKRRIEDKDLIVVAEIED